MMVKCAGVGCPKANSCERYNRPSTVNQEWFVRIPYSFKFAVCTEYIKREEVKDDA